VTGPIKLVASILALSKKLANDKTPAEKFKEYQSEHPGTHKNQNDPLFIGKTTSGQQIPDVSHPAYKGLFPEKGEYSEYNGHDYGPWYNNSREPAPGRHKATVELEKRFKDYSPKDHAEAAQHHNSKSLDAWREQGDLVKQTLERPEVKAKGVKQHHVSTPWDGFKGHEAFPADVNQKLDVLRKKQKDHQNASALHKAAAGQFYHVSPEQLKNNQEQFHRNRFKDELKDGYHPNGNKPNESERLFQDFMQKRNPELPKVAVKK